MHTLLLIAHGSRNAGANEEIRLLADKIRIDPENGFDQVSYAFLELAEPTIADAIASLVDQGADVISVFPYFLAGGVHVSKDVPEIINEARTHHGHVEFKILPYLGAIENLGTLILQQINADERD